MLQTLLALIPTILFVLMILWGFLLGLARGLRKSIILLIQAAVAFAIALTFYLIMVNLPAADKMVVDATNTFMGAGGLQTQLGVSATNETLTDILTEFIINKVNYGEGMTLALQENANYLATMVNLVYHLVFFFISLLLYDILLFLFYLIYVLFYPERRYRTKKQKKELEANSEYVYKKRSLWGGLVGFLRGFVVAFIYMSFIGAILFMLGGGIGEKQYKTEYDFGSQEKNRLYNVYEALGSYGNHGILKVMNLAKDKNEIPYYYFAANIVLSGKLVDEDLGINENINFTQEIGQYTRLVRDTLDLMMEVDSATCIALINQEIKIDDDRVFAILGNETFRTGFSQLIKKFDSGKYFINFALSMLDSIAAHLDQISFADEMDPQTKEILLVLLKSDHYSEYIPDDQVKKNNHQKVDTIKLSQLLVKEDVDALLNVALELIGMPSGTTDSAKLKFYSEKLVPALKTLSIFNDETKTPGLNKTLERLFVAIDNMYKPEDSTSLTVERLELLADTNVVWTNEIKTLLDTLASGCDLLSYVINDYPDIAQTKSVEQIVRIFFTVFHGTNKTNTIQAYNQIEANLKSSKIVDKVLSISVINQALIGGITSNFSDVYVPETIRFTDNGDEPGELSCFLGAFRSILENEENEEIILGFLNGEDKGEFETLELITELCDNLRMENSQGKKAIDYISKSTIIQVVLSGFLINNKQLGQLGEIYLPDSVFVTVDGEIKNLIKQEEIEDLVNQIPDLLNPVLDYLALDEEDRDIDTLFNGIKTGARGSLDNIIIEGTISNIARGLLLKTGKINIPSYLDTTEEWLSTEDEPGEFKKILAAKDVINLRIQDLMNEGLDQTIDSLISSLNDKVDGEDKTKLEKICESGIIYSTLSDAIDTLLTDDLVSPAAKLASKVLYKGESEYSLDELSALVDVITSLDLDVTAIDLSSIINSITTLTTVNPGETESRLDILYKSILARSLAYNKLNEIITSNDLLVDTDLAKETIEGVVTIYKKSELEAIINVLSKIGVDTKLDSIPIEDAITCDSVENLCKSEIIYATVSNALDTYITDDMVSPNAKAASKITYHGEIRYSKEELAALVDVVKEFDLNVKEIDFSALTDDIGSLNKIEAPKTESKLDILYKSIMARSIMYNKINGIITSNDLLVDTNLAKETINTNVTIYKKAELDAIINVISKLGAGVKLENLPIEDVIVCDSVENLCKSEIIYATISNALDTYITNDMVEANAKTASKVEYEGEIRYSKEELTALVDVVKEFDLNVKAIDFSGLINDLGNLNKVEAPKTESKLDILYKSIMARSIMYNKLNGIITSSALLVDTPEAKELINTNVTIYKKAEVSALVEVMSDLGEGVTVNNITLDNIVLTDDIITGVGDSSILTATLSKSLIDKDILTIVTEDYDSTNSHIKATSLTALLQSVKDGLGVTNVNAFSADSIKLPSGDKIDTLLQSDIMRATVSNKISTTSSDIYVAKTQAEVKTTFEGDDTIIVSKAELKSFINGVNDLSPDDDFNVTLSKETLKKLKDEGHVDDAIESSILRVIISEYVFEAASVYASTIPASEKENLSVYDISTTLTDTKIVLSETAINGGIDFIVALP